MASMGWIKRIPIAILWIKRITIAILWITMLHCINRTLSASNDSLHSVADIRFYSSMWEIESAREKHKLAIQVEALSNSLTIQTQVTFHWLSHVLISGLLLALIKQFDSARKKNEALKRIESALIDLKDKNVS